VNDDLDALTARFTADMRRGVRELSRLGYDATLFTRMLAEHGAVDAARRLINNPAPSYGLWRLKELRKLDMSVEMWVLLPWYEPLFDPETREAADRKLRLLDVDVTAELAGLQRRLGLDDAGS
jgi:hypothetical protein